MKSQTVKLIIASSESDANLYYATHFLVPDPVIYFEINGKKALVLSDLEIDRAKVQAKVHSILSLSDLSKKLAGQDKKFKVHPPYARIIHEIFSNKKIKEITVPANFPSLYYSALKKMGYNIIIKPDPFFEERLIKTTEEKNFIKENIKMVGIALKEALLLLEKSKIKGKKIYYGKEVVTSEMMQTVINTKLMELGCIGQHTIAASGGQGSLPHHHGSGPLVAHTPIIFDIFPRSSRNHYFADMTRTVVKGKPSDMAKKMYAAVLESNQCGHDAIKAGVTAAAVHQAAADALKRHGFETGKLDGRMQGFIHSTGHGLGLDIHEPPSVSPNGGPLKIGNVITVEPGLYYEKHGGVRLEDVAYVTKNGSECLTDIPKKFEIDRF